jgi:uncharacterized protein involved in exopolysaccharide biosynthesis
MSDDPTRKLPGDGKELSAPQDDDRIGLLISAVQSLSSDIQEVKVRIEALEKTVTERSFETKPIWERALAAIAETRADLAEVRTELAEVRTELAEVRTELAETRAELKAEIAEVRAELRAEMKDGFRKLGLKIELLNEDSLTLRADQRSLAKRVDALETNTP